MRSHYFSIEKEKEREKERGRGGEREGNEDAWKSGRSPDQGTKLRGGRAQTSDPYIPTTRRQTRYLDLFRPLYILLEE